LAISTIQPITLPSPFPTLHITFNQYRIMMSDETPADNPGSSSQAQSSGIKVHIVVQPPERVGVRRRLVPPLVARTDNPQLLDDFMSGRKHVFATLMLTASNGADATSNLRGTYSRDGQGVNLYPKNSKKKGGGSSSSSQRPHQWIYFIFPGLSVSEPGMYSLTVCVNTLALPDAFMTTVGWKATRVITIVNEAVPPGRPSTFFVVSVVLERLEKNAD
jgi:hypothetical protein